MKKIELKAKQFGKRYVQNKFNGTKTAMELYNAKERGTAQSIATENLSKPVFQKAIQEALEDSSINRTKRRELMTRNASQSNNLAASNTALDMVNKIAGDYAPEKRESINITLTGKDIDTRLIEIDKELEGLKGA